MAASAGLSALALSTALMVSPPSLSSGRACMANYFTGPATLLLNPLQLLHLTRSQHLTLHHPPSSLENCPIPGLGSPLTSLAAPSQSPGLAPFFQLAHYLLVFPRVSSLALIFSWLMLYSEYQGGLLVDHRSQRWDVHFVSVCVTRHLFLGGDG